MQVQYLVWWVWSSTVERLKTWLLCFGLYRSWKGWIDDVIILVFSAPERRAINSSLLEVFSSSNLTEMELRRARAIGKTSCVSGGSCPQSINLAQTSPTFPCDGENYTNFQTTRTLHMHGQGGGKGGGCKTMTFLGLHNLHNLHKSNIYWSISLWFMNRVQACRGSTVQNLLCLKRAFAPRGCSDSQLKLVF